MKHQSIIQKRNQVPFPAFMAERVYMKEFTKSKGLPSELSRWQPTVDAMLEGVDTDGPIYIMIDQGVISAGESHRRPGMHLDGYWCPASQSHGGGRHFTQGSWRAGSWDTLDFSEPEAIILASDVQACKAVAGEWEGICLEGGDCKHIDTSSMQEIMLEAGAAYAGNVTMLHESIALKQDTMRSLVRLNVPGWSPKKTVLN
jgi:hypothetical protein